MQGLKDLQSEVEAELIEVKTHLCAVGSQTLKQVSPSPIYRDYREIEINYSGGEFALSTLFAVNKKYESYIAKDPEIANLKFLKKGYFKYTGVGESDHDRIADQALIRTLSNKMMAKIDKHFDYQVTKIAKDLKKDPYGFINITNSLAYNLLVEKLGWHGVEPAWEHSNQPEYKPFLITYSIMKHFADNYK